jgi:hypothetical protein
MKGVKGYFTIVFLICSIRTYSQDKLFTIIFKPTFSTKLINLADSNFKFNDSLQVELGTVKFYISNIKLLNRNKIVFQDKNLAYLIDASVPKSLQILLDTKDNSFCDNITFDLGIDSALNVQGAMADDLDPTKGMYWAWQSGYINFKLEGKSKQCKSRNNEFEFHLGGYLQPNYCLQNVVLPLNKTSTIGIKLDIEKVLSEIDLTIVDHVMSPSLEAVAISKIVANSFSITEE